MTTAASLLSEPLLVINQAPAQVGTDREFAIYDRRGSQRGAIRRIGPSGLRRAAGSVGPLRSLMTQRLEVVDMAGELLLQITRPPKRVKARVVVESRAGVEIGMVVQEAAGAAGAVGFALKVDGRRVGAIRAESWEDWQFSLRDADDAEVATVTKQFAGWGDGLFSPDQQYVLEISQHHVLEPLRPLLVASALSLETALRPPMERDVPHRL